MACMVRINNNYDCCKTIATRTIQYGEGEKKDPLTAPNLSREYNTSRQEKRARRGGGSYHARATTYAAGYHTLPYAAVSQTNKHTHARTHHYILRSTYTSCTSYCTCVEQNSHNEHADFYISQTTHKYPSINIFSAYIMPHKKATIQQKHQVPQ